MTNFQHPIPTPRKRCRNSRDTPKLEVWCVQKSLKLKHKEPSYKKEYKRTGLKQNNWNYGKLLSVLVAITETIFGCLSLPSYSMNDFREIIKKRWSITLPPTWMGRRMLNGMCTCRRSRVAETPKGDPYSNHDGWSVQETQIIGQITWRISPSP